MNAKATIGQVGNYRPREHPDRQSRPQAPHGRSPTVRGSVMNPCDHPHGGGEGKSPIGKPGPVTPWGKPALGYKTRKHKNPTNKYIVRRSNGSSK
jgi:large subunit ribosomal protein L2